MDHRRRYDPVRLWSEYGSRLLRFGGVTVVTTTVGLITLALGLEVFGWAEVPANLVSVLASTPFGYFLNRTYVWERQPGNHSAAREVGPFWIMTLLGFVVSTVAIGLVGSFTDSTPLLLLTQIAAFGSLWLVKFYFLEKVLWSDDSEAVAERV